jgi:hypothetical protein
MTKVIGKAHTHDAATDNNNARSAGEFVRHRVNPLSRFLSRQANRTKVPTATMYGTNV